MPDENPIENPTENPPQKRNERTEAKFLEDADKLIAEAYLDIRLMLKVAV